MTGDFSSLDIERIGVWDGFERPSRAENLRRALKERHDRDVVIADEQSIDRCDVVVTVRHDDAFFDSVRWVQTITAGIDHFPVDEYEPRGILFTNSRGLAGDIIGESVVGYLLSLSRGLHLYRDQQNDGTWDRLALDRAFTLTDESLCVVGVGQLGGSVVDRAGAIGMDVTGVDIRPISSLHLDHVSDFSNLHEAIRDVRFVVLTAPLTDETRRMMGTEEFAVMAEDSYLINVGRGELLDQDALLKAVRTNEIAGAAVDVFHEEPLPEESPLWDEEEIIVTPHAAGQSHHYDDLVADLVETNVERIRLGNPPWNRIV